MSDPRNVAHAKKVEQEKEHGKPESAAGAKPKKGKKPAGDKNGTSESTPAPTVAAKVEQVSADLEKSSAVLSKLKEMEFHSRANIETLAGLTLTIEDELKQKEFSELVGAVYSAQDGFQTKIAELIARYEAKCESLKQPE